MQPLLSVTGLSVEFRGRDRVTPAVRDLSFDLNGRETLALVGESGSGKSVTALSVMRLIEQEGGAITGGSAVFRHEGRSHDLLGLSSRQMRRLRGKALSMIFQEPMTSLNPVLTIGDQLAEVPMRHEGASETVALAAARDALDRVRLSDAAARLRQYPHEISGGMRQRVMIAMALMCRPRLLIADEPTTALDVTVQAQIVALLDELKRDMGMSMLFITHDLGVVAEIADRVLVMRNGARVEENGCEELFATPAADYTRALLAAVPRLGSEQGPSPLPEGRPLLHVEGLTKRFPVRRGLLRRTVGHIHAVEQVSFRIGAGETLALVGESGSGKSTTGRLVMRLIEPTAGSITLCDRDLRALSARDLRQARRDVQMVFQDPYASLNPRLSAFDLVTEPLAIHAPHIGRDERRARAEALLCRVGLEGAHLDRFPHQFSGGQRQRLAIARALCLEPRLIIADEPVSALDVSVQAQVLELMRELQKELGLSYLFISHDIAAVERVSHRVAVMHMGQIVETGPTAQVLGRPHHPYTTRLLASVPTPDPARRRIRRVPDATDIPASPFRRRGEEPATPPFTAVGPGHFVQDVAT